jgi:hypothetical protein
VPTPFLSEITRKTALNIDKKSFEFTNITDKVLVVVVQYIYDKLKKISEDFK